MSTRTEYRTCPFCEATCGLEVSLDGDSVTRVKGDEDDVLSHGFICPKATGLKALPEDPDRIRTPLVRDAGGTLRPASWDEALAAIDAGLSPVLGDDRNAVAAYLGNPNAHNLDAMVYGRVLLKALGPRTSTRPRPSTRCPNRSRPASCSGRSSACPCRTWTAASTC